MDVPVARGPHGLANQHTSIARLDEDVLFKIFLDNTDFHHDQRLTTARQNSQVCRYWRSVILRSPLIWARLIDLSGRGSTPAWIGEVMSRAALGPIWIKGPIKFPELLLPFIQDNWERVERLDVTDVPDYQIGYWDALFKFPAPNLKEFSFVYYESPNQYEASGVLDPAAQIVQRGILWFPPGTIFNDAASPLKKFGLYRRSRGREHLNLGHTLDMPMTWLSNLRTLSVRWTLDTNGLLALLSSTPFLEDLEMCGFNTACSSSQKSINLPRLISICFEECTQSFTATFLESVVPCSGCCLFIPIPNARIYEPQFSGHRLLTPVTAYIEGYFFKHGPRSVSLSFPYESFFSMKDYSVSSRSRKLSIIVDTQLHGDIVQSLLDSPCFHCVRELNLYSWRASPMRSLLGFASVTTLITGSESLNLMTQRASSEPILPRLQLVKIAEGEGTGFTYETLLPRFPECVHLFLQQRRDAGLHIDITLDLSALQPKDLLYDLENLEEFRGLWVRWRTSTFDPEGSKKIYVCGSGHPEQLCFEKERSTEGYVHPAFAQCGRRIYVQGWSGEIV
ncbi:hypothetical protein D9613_010882 [Agrocybe pediades]|uniref:F-box domain-containing protein n=1 Tax=Agrocybe pediades TaxID=84607 RepID=A0A8H4VKQ6_9AGAR|nr:hypothetical protein D9613_010882 [Agrocybe pediades]